MLKVRDRVSEGKGTQYCLVKRRTQSCHSDGRVRGAFRRKESRGIFPSVQNDNLGNTNV